MSADSSSTSAPPALAETSRRRLLALVGAGSAAAAASLLSADQARAGHDGTNVLHLGESNTVPADESTEIITDVEAGEGFGLKVDNSGGEAIRANGFGGDDEDNPGAGVQGIVSGSLGFGVRGVSGDDPDVVPGDPGFGEGPAVGVMGISGTGVGVSGIAKDAAGIGVEAENFSTDGLGTALVVRGRSLFSTTGSGVVPAGQNSAFVEDGGVTEFSHITLTLVSDPGLRQLQWVERDPGSGFTVHLSSAPPPRRRETSFTYLIVEPAE